MSLLLYLDTETTGRDPSTCGMTQLSAIIVRDGVELDRININVNPYSYKRNIVVSKKALEVTNKTERDLLQGLNSNVAFVQFSSFLERNRAKGEYYTLVAYRTTYDLGVLLSWFEDIRGNSEILYEYIHFKTLDILQLVLFLELYNKFDSLKNHKLETMCEYYGIPLKAHDSMNDIVATRMLHKKLMGELRLPANTIKTV